MLLSLTAQAAVTDSSSPGPDLAQLLRLRAGPHHPPNPGQPAAGVGQPWRPGARPGPGLGATGPHGGQQLGQLIGRGGHRRGRGGGAAAGFPQADRRGRGGQLEQAQGTAAGTVGQFRFSNNRTTRDTGRQQQQQPGLTVRPGAAGMRRRRAVGRSRGRRCNPRGSLAACLHPPPAECRHPPRIGPWQRRQCRPTAKTEKKR